MYPPLVRNLRKYSSKEGLSDAQVIREWKFYTNDIDESVSTNCICGKEEIKYLFFLYNVNILDDEERIFRKVIVGEEYTLQYAFCSTGLPLSRTRCVRSTFSNHCPLSSNQWCWLISATGNWTQGNGSGCKNALHMLKIINGALTAWRWQFLSQVWPNAFCSKFF